VKHNKCNEKFRGESIEAELVEIFLATIGSLEVYRKEYVRGSDNSDAVLTLQRNIQDLEEEKDEGLFVGEEGKVRYFARKKKMLSRLATLEAQPIQHAGWNVVPTGKTYNDLWVSASIKERRELLIESGVVAFAGRTDAMEFATNATNELLNENTAEIPTIVSLGPDDLKAYDLNLVIQWRGNLAVRIRQQLTR
jgi:hypothetical protein